MKQKICAEIASEIAPIVQPIVEKSSLQSCPQIAPKIHEVEKKHTRSDDITPQYPTPGTPLVLQVKVINFGSDTFGNPIFQKGLQN